MLRRESTTITLPPLPPEVVWAPQPSPPGKARGVERSPVFPGVTGPPPEELLELDELEELLELDEELLLPVAKVLKVLISDVSELSPLLAAQVVSW